MGIQNKSIIAFDILPMASTQRQGGVRVAAVAKFANGEMKEWSELSRKKLLNIIQNNDFTYIGTDNPAEIIKEGESIASFSKKIPGNSSLVHVNLTRSGNTVALRSLIDQYNITSERSKLSPVKTARAMVNLIELGVGMVLEPFENETIIKVGKPSSSSKGGWSQARYQRQAEEVVGREANKIREILKQNNTDFDEIIHSTKYGAKLARFHIFKSLNEIKKYFEHVSFYPAKVKIWSPKKPVVTHRPIDIAHKPERVQFYNHLQRLIIGIDPGMTTGVAISNLNGRILSVFSRNNLSKGQLVSEISNFGVPVLVCADVSPVPTFVSKIAATYNAELFAPDIEMSKIDKRHLANKASIDKRIDSHERDAVAAIMRAYQKYEPHFKKIDNSELSRKEKELSKGLIIRGISVKDAIEAVVLLNKPEEKQKVVPDKPISSPDLELIGRVSNLLEDMAHSEQIISNLRAHTGRIEAKNELLEGRIKRLKRELRTNRQEKLRKALNSEIIEEKDKQISRLRNKMKDQEDQLNKSQKHINDLEEMLWLSLEQESHPVKILTKFSHDHIEELRRSMGLANGDIILIRDPTGGGPQTAQNLAKHKLKFIFTENYDMPKPAAEIFYHDEIPVLRAEKYSIQITDYLGLINSQNLLIAQEDYNRYVEERKTQEKSERIMKTIENYQYERKKELINGIKNYDDYEPEEDLDME